MTRCFVPKWRRNFADRSSCMDTTRDRFSPPADHFPASERKKSAGKSDERSPRVPIRALTVNERHCNADCIAVSTVLGLERPTILQQGVTQYSRYQPSAVSRLAA